MHGHDGARSRRNGRLDLVEIDIAESRPTSTKTGRAPVRVIVLAVATKLIAGVMTSCPSPMPQASKAISRLAVAEVCVRIGHPPR